MKVEIRCNYCGYKTAEVVKSTRVSSYESFVRNLSCNKCGDKNLDIKEISIDKADYYIGCPPFEEKKKADPEDQRMRDISDLSEMGYLWGMGNN